VENCRSVLAAAALMFFAGTAGAGGAAGRLRASTKRTRGFVGWERPGRIRGGEHGVDGGIVGEFLFAKFGYSLLVYVFLNYVNVAQAEHGDVGAFIEPGVAVLALGLELAEFGGAFVEEAVREGAGAIDGELEFCGGFLVHRIVEIFEIAETFFNLATAAESPHDAADFVDEVEFEGAFGNEAFLEVPGEFGVGVVLVGPDEVAGGEEAKADGVLGGGGFTGVCLGAAAVVFIGCGLSLRGRGELGWCRHSCFSFRVVP